jgi:SAM-dependent methyltransferase
MLFPYVCKVFRQFHNREGTDMVFRLLAAWSLVAVMGVSPALAQDASVAPTINQNFKSDDLDVEGWATRFSGESREAFHARNDVVNAMALKPGETIADVGAGTGIYTRLFAQAVGPTGTVTATDLAPKFLAYIAANAAKDGLKMCAPFRRAIAPPTCRRRRWT